MSNGIGFLEDVEPELSFLETMLEKIMIDSKKRNLNSLQSIRYNFFNEAEKSVRQLLKISAFIQHFKSFDY